MRTSSLLSFLFSCVSAEITQYIPVPILPRSAYLRQTTRRKMAPGLPSRLPLRALPTLNGIPVPPHARRCQPTSSALASHVPNDSQGLHSYTCVVMPTTLTRFRFVVLIIILIIGNKVFDRMFSLGVRGSGTDTAPLGARVAAVAGMASATLPRRHFLYCSLRPENPIPPRGQRHHRREIGS
jgi:hypothetical protein